LIIDNLEEAVSLFDLYNHDLPSLRAAAYRPSEQATCLRFTQGRAKASPGLMTAPAR